MYKYAGRWRLDLLVSVRPFIGDAAEIAGVDNDGVDFTELSRTVWTLLSRRPIHKMRKKSVQLDCKKYIYNKSPIDLRRILQQYCSVVQCLQIFSLNYFT